MILFRFFYLWFFFPLFFLTVFLASFFNKKIADGLRARLYPRKETQIKKSPIWIHASSGEFEYAKPVITEIKKQYPDIPILVTYFSPTYARNIETFKGVDMCAPLPLDLPGPLSQFIRKYQPRALLFARTDLWPELLYQCRVRSIPTYIFSAVVNENSSFITKLWREFLFKKLNQIFLVSKSDLSALSESLQKKSYVIGDTRYDQVFARLASPKPLPDVIKHNTGFMAVAGSSWPEDEAVLAKVIKNTNSFMRWVLAPHEPTDSHLSSLENKLSSLGLSSQRLSAAEKSSWNKDSVLLIDRVGILAELYTKADIAFVGGSYRKKVHSVMEPLAAGCVTFVGPLHSNNGEAVLFKNIQLRRSPICSVQVAENENEFTQKLIKIYDDYLSKNLFLKEEIIEQISSYRGATSQLIERLRSLFSV